MFHLHLLPPLPEVLQLGFDLVGLLPRVRGDLFVAARGNEVRPPPVLRKPPVELPDLHVPAVHLRLQLRDLLVLLLRVLRLRDLPCVLFELLRELCIRLLQLLEEVRDLLVPLSQSSAQLVDIIGSSFAFISLNNALLSSLFRCFAIVLLLATSILHFLLPFGATLAFLALFRRIT